VKDANGQQIAYLYFEDEPQRQMSMKRLSRDEAFLIAVNIAKLPSVPRQILKDVPRPPNTVARTEGNGERAEFQPAGGSSITPHFRPFAASLRLLRCRTPIPSIFERGPHGVSRVCRRRF